MIIMMIKDDENVIKTTEAITFVAFLLKITFLEAAEKMLNGVVEGKLFPLGDDIEGAKEELKGIIKEEKLKIGILQ